MVQQPPVCVSLLWIIICLDKVFMGLSAPDGKYLGCFKDKGNPRSFKGHVEHFGTNLTPLLCTEVCYSKGFLYSATQARTYCFCGDKPPRPTSKVSEDQCSKSCSGNPAEKCGGGATLSVTTTGIPDYPETEGYLGCFHDVYRTFNDFSVTYEKTNTPRRCMNVCLYLGYKYAGVQNSKECKCGNVVLSKEFALDGDDCEWPCSGDSSENCGGNARLALYSTYVANGCEGSWPPPGKKKYYVETVKMGNWHESLMACLRNNTRLATADNMEEFQQLRDAIKRTGKRFVAFYLSATDVGLEGDYVWVTNGKTLPGKGPMWESPLNNQPDNWNNAEHCISLWEPNEMEGLILNDGPCEGKAHYVCEYYEK